MLSIPGQEEEPEHAASSSEGRQRGEAAPWPCQACSPERVQPRSLQRQLSLLRAGAFSGLSDQGTEHSCLEDSAGPHLARPREGSRPAHSSITFGGATV